MCTVLAAVIITVAALTILATLAWALIHGAEIIRRNHK